MTRDTDSDQAPFVPNPSFWRERTTGFSNELQCEIDQLQIVDIAAECDAAERR